MSAPVRFMLPVPQSDLARMSARIWSKTSIRHADQCWLWQGAKWRSGYGVMSFQGQHTTVTRLVWLSIFGESPRNLICHTCDNPSCVNPCHLWDGTAQENSADMSAKNRGVKPLSDAEFLRRLRARYQAAQAARLALTGAPA